MINFVGIVFVLPADIKFPQVVTTGSMIIKVLQLCQLSDFGRWIQIK